MVAMGWLLTVAQVMFPQPSAISANFCHGPARGSSVPYWASAPWLRLRVSRVRRKIGFALLADGQTQVADQRPAALVDHRRQSGADARAVIDDALNGAWCAIVFAHKSQVNAPDAVDTHRCRALVAQIAENVEQRVLVLCTICVMYLR